MGADNTEDGILGLRMLYAFGPAVGMTFCALAAWNYPLTRERRRDPTSQNIEAQSP